MKKLIMKILLLMIPFTGFIITINHFYVHSNYWKSKDNIYKFYSIPDGITLANVGSSHGEVNWLYEDFPEYTAFNFGVSAQYHNYSYAILKQFITKFHDGAVVLIPISYFEITQVPSEEEQAKKRSRYYRFMAREYMEEVDEWMYWDYFRYAVFPILSARDNEISKIVFDIPAEKIDIFWNRTTHRTGKDLERYCLDKHKRWTDPKMEKGDTGFAYNFQAVCTLIDFCRKNGLVPVLITTPITDVLNRYFEQTDGFFDVFYRFTSKLQEKYPDIRYFDYSHDNDFSPYHELFFDGDHLNVYGAKAFTARVIADLKNALILK